MESREYYSIINMIRKSKGLSVESLCEGIVTTRTYYNYLRFESKMNMTVFSKITNRLDMNPIEIIYYATFLSRKSDPCVLRFIYRVSIENFDDIDTFYKKVLKMVPPNEQYGLVIKSFVARYEHIIGKTDITQYKSIMANIVNTIQISRESDIYDIIAYTIFLEVNPNGEGLYSVADALYASDPGINPMLYVIAFDMLMNIFIENQKFIDLVLYSGIIEKMEFWVDLTERLPYKARYSLYAAFCAKLKGDLNTMSRFLLRYGISILSIFTSAKCRKAADQVKRVFGIDISEYVEKRIPKLFDQREVLA